ncbi:hypothetical protein [Duganella sp. Root1480D1]|uniref:hypothetical protein n=1 Tax=Duganella sp. Root1480D1 TaxID=1736471 RepID=UPI000709724E|nr:hypothetical protein [Duganella sp. Root1480D1]
MRSFEYKYFLLAMFAFLIVSCSHVDEVTPRKYLAFVVADLELQRNAISKALLSDKDVPIAGSLVWRPTDGTKTPPPDFGWITRAGVIFVHNEKFGVILVQEPKIINGKVIWSCVVHPTSAKPKLCD